MFKIRVPQHRPNTVAHLALGIMLGSTLVTAIVFLAGAR